MRKNAPFAFLPIIWFFKRKTIVKIIISFSTMLGNMVEYLAEHNAATNLEETGTQDLTCDANDFNQTIIGENNMCWQ